MAKTDTATTQVRLAEVQAAQAAQTDARVTDPRTGAPVQPGPEVQAAMDAAREPVSKPKLDGKTVTMVFPRAVTVTTNDHRRVMFEAGPQEVPEHLADHPYLRLNGVTPYVKPVKPAEE